MKKETIIAILLGIIFGTIIAVVIVSKNKQTQLEKTKTIAPTINLESKASVTVAPVQPLEIMSPGDGQIFSKNSVTIKGKTYKGSLIVIQSPIKDIVISNAQENFSVDFPLVNGENAIRISVYPKDKQIKSQEKELKIYFLNEQL